MRKIWANLLTASNLLLGMVALLLAMQGNFQLAALLVIVGTVVDGLDGRVARALGTQSDFGRELDSLSDLVIFGVAPAVIMYVADLHSLGWLGMVITALFPLAGALRLAKFNIQKGHTNYFVGLPITAAGGTLAAFTLYHGLLPGVPSILTVMLSYLMISKTRYPNFKKLGIPKATFVIIPVLVISVIPLFVMDKVGVAQGILSLLVLYGVYGLVYDARAAWRRLEKSRRIPSEED